MPIWCVYQKNDKVSTHGKTLERAFEKKRTLGGSVRGIGSHRGRRSRGDVMRQIYIYIYIVLKKRTRGCTRHRAGG